MTPSIPDRASNAGPESQEKDWRDWIDEARDEARDAYRTPSGIAFHPEVRNRARIEAIDRAIAALQEARELLCH